MVYLLGLGRKRLKNRSAWTVCQTLRLNFFGIAAYGMRIGITRCRYSGPPTGLNTPGELGVWLSSTT